MRLSLSSALVVMQVGLSMVPLPAPVCLRAASRSYKAKTSDSIAATCCWSASIHDSPVWAS